MATLRVQDILKDRILLMRESARVLADPLRVLMVGNGGTDLRAPSITIDFTGIEGISPSFFEGLLSVVEAQLALGAEGVETTLLVAHPPSRLSSKFVAVARGHALTIEERPDGSWLLSPAGTPDPQT